MRRAGSILVTCALLFMLVRPLIGQACCAQAQCCDSAMCPMKARPAATTAAPGVVQPADEMQCHKRIENSPQKRAPDCVMKSACSQTELPSTLPSLTRAILLTAALLPAPQSARSEMLSSAPAAFPGFPSPFLQPPRA
jgi:hypothetical protein